MDTVKGHSLCSTLLTMLLLTIVESTCKYRIQLFTNENNKQECIPVGCVPAAP